MKVIGIDLGTTYSVMAHVVGGKPVAIPNAEGKLLTPSVVSWDKDGRIYVGEIARSRAMFDPERTVFSIKRQMGRDVKIHIDDREYTPQTISAYILRKLKNDAEKYLGMPVDKAVITVPAYFNEQARASTKEAGIIAGFEVLRILNEPTAATLAYGLGHKDGELVMVWDLGGGTFDVSILEFADGVYQVKSTSGDTWLGGDDWTSHITTFIAEKFENELGKKVSTRPEIRERIKIAAETAKIELTTKQEARINLPCLEDMDKRLCSFHTSIKRTEFNEIVKELMERVIIPVETALKDSGLKFADMNKIILVGGATRMPQVRELVTTMSGKESFTDIDPDVVIGLGAAVQTGILTGEMIDTVLVDVIPISLGLETRGGIFTRFIKRNSAIPTSYSQIFTTAKDDQTEVEIHVLQGERELASHNISLGRFCLTDIPPLPKGTAKIEVKFEVDANGILNVTATDIYTNNEQMITVKSNRINDKDLIKLAAENLKYHEQDQCELDGILMRITADDTIEAAIETLPKLTVGEVFVERINEAISESRRLLERGDVNELKVSVDRLKKLMDEAMTHAKKTSA